jgi:hypothetical protein
VPLYSKELALNLREKRTGVKSLETVYCSIRQVLEQKAQPIPPSSRRVASFHHDRDMLTDTHAQVRQDHQSGIFDNLRKSTKTMRSTDTKRTKDRGDEENLTNKAQQRYRPR